MTEITSEEQEAIDPIQSIFKSQCTSLSGRSEIDFEVGRHIEADSLHVRVCGNSAAGMFSKNWISAESIQDIVLGATELTAKSLAPLYVGTSTNSAGFLLVSLRALGLVRVSEVNTRHHEHAPGTTLAKVVQDCMGSNAPKSRRKGGG
ncbi:MAG: hypothetical protein U1E84_11725 [Rhodoferax sp.]